MTMTLSEIKQELLYLAEDGDMPLEMVFDSAAIGGAADWSEGEELTLLEEVLNNLRQSHSYLPGYRAWLLWRTLEDALMITARLQTTGNSDPEILSMLEELLSYFE